MSELKFTEEQLKNLKQKMENYDEEHLRSIINFENNVSDDTDFLTILETIFGKTAVLGYCKCRAFELLWKYSGEENLRKYIDYLKS